MYTVDGRGLETGGLTAEDNPTTRDRGPGPGGGGNGLPGRNAVGVEGGGTMIGGPSSLASTGNEIALPPSARIVSSLNTRLRSLVDSQESLQFIANQTGGLAVANTNDLNLGLSRVLADQQGYYLLGYVAPGARPGAAGIRIASRSA